MYKKLLNLTSLGPFFPKRKLKPSTGGPWPTSQRPQGHQRPGRAPGSASDSVPRIPHAAGRGEVGPHRGSPLGSHPCLPKLHPRSNSLRAGRLEREARRPDPRNRPPHSKRSPPLRPEQPLHLRRPGLPGAKHAGRALGAGPGAGTIGGGTLGAGTGAGARGGAEARGGAPTRSLAAMAGDIVALFLLRT